MATDDEGTGGTAGSTGSGGGASPSSGSGSHNATSANAHFRDGVERLKPLGKATAKFVLVRALSSGPLEGPANWIAEQLEEHTPLGALLKSISGDADAINAIAGQWTELGRKISHTQAHHAALAGDLSSWHGPEAEAYARVTKDMNDLFTTAGMAANAMAGVLTMAAELVQKIYDLAHGLVKWFISRQLAKVVLTGPLAGVAIAWIIKDAWDLINRIESEIQAFKAAIDTIVNVARNAQSIFMQAKAALDALRAELEGRAQKLRSAMRTLPAGAPIGKSEAREIAERVDARHTREQAAQETAAARDRPAAERRETAGEAVQTPGERVLSNGESAAATAGGWQETMMETDRYASKMGYHYPTVPASKPLMPRAPSAIEEIQQQKAQRKH